jgi:hypothetical protein
VLLLLLVDVCVLVALLTQGEVEEALLEQELRDQVLTRQMRLIAPVLNSDGDTETQSEDDDNARTSMCNSIGNFSFH